MPVLAEVPLDPRLRAGGDPGSPIVVEDPETPAAKALHGLADGLAARGRNLLGRQLGLSPGLTARSRPPALPPPVRAPTRRGGERDDTLSVVTIDDEASDQSAGRVRAERGQSHVASRSYGAWVGVAFAIASAGPPGLISLAPSMESRTDSRLSPRVSPMPVISALTSAMTELSSRFFWMNERGLRSRKSRFSNSGPSCG